MKCPLKEDNFGRMPDCQPDCAWMVNGVCAVAARYYDVDANDDLPPENDISAESVCANDANDALDSREKLEADCEKLIGNIQERIFSGRDAGALRFQLRELLNRQAAITERECLVQSVQGADAILTAENAKLTEQVSTLTEFRDRWRSRWTERNAEYDELLDEYNELKAERDEWKEKAEARSHGWAKANIGWAESNAEAERWRQRCARMQGNRGGQYEDEARELAAERDYWKQEVALCMQSAYPPSHSPERAYDPDVMAYPDRHGCTTPSTLVSAVIDGLRDEKTAEYMGLLDETVKLKDESERVAADLKACQGQLKTERNNFSQMQGARDYWRDKLAMVLRRLKELGCDVGSLHDVPIRVELPPRDEGLA